MNNGNNNVGKRTINKKILLGILSLMLGIAIIVVSSFFPFIIDPSQWMTKEFLTNELIIVAIVIFAMVSVMFVGQASNAANPNSDIARAIRHFNNTIVKIVNYNAFFQWIRKVQQPDDIAQIKEREMRNAGIDDFSIIKLSIPEINALIETPQKYEGKFYKAITKQQAKLLIRLKTKHNIYLVQPNYYLTYKTVDSDKTITEKSGNESKKKSSIVIFSVISKAIVTIITAMIFTSFIYDSASEKEIAEAWINFIARMSALISSSYMGFLVGSQINDVDADYIEMRCLVLEKYLADKDFKPLTQQEEAKEQFIERVKEENVLCLTGGDKNE